MFRGERLKLAPVQVAVQGASADGEPVARLAPGELEVNRRSVRVGTATSPVLLGEVQPHGKRPMPASDWARGVRIAAGERFDG